MPIEKIDKGSRQYFCNLVLCGGLYGGTCTSPEYEIGSLDDLNEIAASDLNKIASIDGNGTEKVNAKLGAKAIDNCYHEIWGCQKGRYLTKQACGTENYVAGVQSVLTPRTPIFTLEETEVRDMHPGVVKALSVSTSWSFALEEDKVEDTYVDVDELQSIWTTSSLSFNEAESKASIDIGVAETRSALTIPSLSFTGQDTELKDKDIDVNETHSVLAAPSLPSTVEETKVGDIDLDVVEDQSVAANPSFSLTVEEAEGYSGSTGDSVSDTAFDDSHTDFPQSNNAVEATNNNNTAQDTLAVQYVPVPPKGPAPKRAIYRFRRCQLEANVGLSAKPFGVPHELDTPANSPTSPRESDPTLENNSETTDRAPDDDVFMETTSCKYSARPVDIGWKIPDQYPAWPQDPPDITGPEAGNEKDSTEEERPTPNPIRYPVLPPAGLIPSLFPIDKHHLPQLNAPRKIRNGRLPCKLVTPRASKTVAKNRNFRQMKASADLDRKILEKTPLFMKSSLGSTPLLKTH